MRLPNVISLFMGLARFTIAENFWILPPEPGPSNCFVADLVWTIGSVQNIQWTTNLAGYDVALFQQSINPAFGIQIETIFSELCPLDHKMRDSNCT